MKSYKVLLDIDEHTEIIDGEPEELIMEILYAMNPQQIKNLIKKIRENICFRCCHHMETCNC